VLKRIRIEKIHIGYLNPATVRRKDGGGSFSFGVSCGGLIQAGIGFKKRFKPRGQRLVLGGRPMPPGTHPRGKWLERWDGPSLRLRTHPKLGKITRVPGRAGWDPFLLVGRM